MITLKKLKKGQIANNLKFCHPRFIGASVGLGEMKYFLAKFCSSPMRKDCVKKKSLSQKLLGTLSLIQTWKN
jgi:hypothetical protein